MSIDTVIIGAGLAGITCARALQAAGRDVVVLDKSRGVGGRLATRRLHGTQAAHGFRVWAPQHPGLQALTEELVAADVLQPWEEGYAAKDGGNAIAKYLARNIPINRQHRVVALSRQQQAWRIESEVPNGDSTALMDVRQMHVRQVVLALPAPQIAEILERSGFSAAATLPLRQVEYAPCVTVMAGYGDAIAGWPHQDQTYQNQILPVNSPLKQIVLDSSKRSQNTSTVMVLHSTADFATGTLPIDRHRLEPAAQQLLQAAEAQVPGLAQPDWFQVHRWRYALVARPYAAAFSALSVPKASPILCCGDWCQPPVPERSPYRNIDAAFQSGQAVAQQILEVRSRG